MAHPPAVGAQASRLARDLALLSSARIPRLLYGTAWKRDQTADLVYMALRVGFRGVDTAAQPKHYDERAVAEGVRRAVAEGLVRREDLFIQSKFTAPGGQSHSMPYDADAPLAEKVRQSVQSSLDIFTLEDQEPYLDSVVLHSPLDTMQETMTAWKTLESYAPHRVRNLGISNADLATVQALLRDESTTVKPAVVQNRFHARTGFDAALRTFCRDNGLVFQSFWTLSANAPLVQSEPVARVARMAGVELAAAYYSLVLGLGNVTVLDGTTSEAHMKEDLEGIEKVGLWAEGNGAADWEDALKSFKAMVGDT
ncbi:aldo/keto reductase family protein [Hirsutella rhossiliensis]|uniref:Aldo/keto reductase family domain-containing protein n=1 Tax=Hirsutella rhossiliensis TaxID=111463 RepID=A0A9P8SLI4_9HYPO|nr:aldo/keto reductase family domain-containing protein [Hirsutella rhossiliensis]KAH0966991.1 aldo/keto reductase family domain-containing protein [Hirsutella rhossiliensis]